MKLKTRMLNCLFLVLALFLLASCKGKVPQKVINNQNAAKASNSKTMNYVPNQLSKKNFISDDEVTDFSWEIYDLLTSISGGENSEEIYKQIEMKYFVKLKDDDSFFPWFEDMLFNRMNFIHIKKLGEDVVCTKTANDKTYFLVQLTVLGNHKYEFTSNNIVEEKSGLTTITLYMMLATKNDGTLGYYNMLSFTKEPHEIDQEIKMFNGIVDAQDEQIYLKATVSEDINTDASSDDNKKLTLNEQYILNTPKVVCVYALDKNGNIQEANGIYVHQYLVLTPLNLENCENAWVYTSDGELIDVVGVVDSSVELSLSLIKLEHDLPYEVSPVEMGKLDDLSKNDIVYLMDSCNGIENNIKEGALINFWMYKEVEYGQTTIPITSEDGGAALFDVYGNLIGIISDNVPDDNSFIQGIEYSNNIFSSYYDQKGKAVAVKTSFDYKNADESLKDLDKLYGYKTLYTNQLLPCELYNNQNEIDRIYAKVEDSINQTNKYISGYYEKGNDIYNNKDYYFSKDMNTDELNELLKLKQEFIDANANEDNQLHYLQYDNIKILGVSEEEAPYVLVSYDLSIYDKGQNTDAPIRKIHGMGLLKYNSDLDVYQLVSTVN